tara:strand:- start:297 stop:860 length:564 start_codon:yes stop_codon:yes gene_type:complete
LVGKRQRTASRRISSHLPVAKLLEPALGSSRTLHLVDQYVTLTLDLGLLLGAQVLILGSNIQLLEPVVLLLHGQVLLLAEPDISLIHLELAAQASLLGSRTQTTLLHVVVTLRTKPVSLHLEVTVGLELLGLKRLLLLSRPLGLTLHLASLTGLLHITEVLQLLLALLLLVNSCLGTSKLWPLRREV